MLPPFSRLPLPLPLLVDALRFRLAAFPALLSPLRSGREFKVWRKEPSQIDDRKQVLGTDLHV